LVQCAGRFQLCCGWATSANRADASSMPFFFRALQICHQFSAEPRHVARRSIAEGLVARLSDNACLGLRLYFKSPSLCQITVIDVDATPDAGCEVELMSDGIAVLTRRRCAALNRRRKVKDFRPATREEIGAYVRRQHGLNQGRAAATRDQNAATAVPLIASATALRHRFRELSNRYLQMSQRALAASKSQPQSRPLVRRRASAKV
jgi:hypothetical protein